MAERRQYQTPLHQRRLQRLALGSASTLLALIVVPLTLLSLWRGINIVLCRICVPPSPQEVVRAVERGAEEEAARASRNRAKR